MKPLKAIVDLLNHFGANYSLLSKEVCCAHPVLELMSHENSSNAHEKEHYEDFARLCLNKNLDQAKNLDARAIVTLCCGCNTMWNSYAKEQSFPIWHHLDLILETFPGLPVNKEVDFFEGCHRLHNFTPHFQESMIESSKKVLAMVEGLTVREISSKLCCRFTPEKVFASSRTDTIIVPSVCCYSFLNLSRPSGGPKVKFIAEMLCESLDSKP